MAFRVASACLVGNRSNTVASLLPVIVLALACGLHVRYPADLWATSLVRVTPQTFIVLDIGTRKDNDIKLSGSGIAEGDVTFESPWGVMADFGFFSCPNAHVGWGFVLRYINQHYNVAGNRIDSQSLCFEVNVQFGT